MIDSEFRVCAGLVIVGEGANRAREGAKRRKSAGNDAKRHLSWKMLGTPANTEETPCSKGASSVGATES